MAKIVNFFTPQGRTHCPMLVKSVGLCEYRPNSSTEVVDIWCDSVGKLGIYRQKNRDGAFSPKFSESSSSETIGPIDKVKGMQKWYGLYLHAKFGGDPPLHGGVRKKSWEFLLFVFHVLDLKLE